ncbi:MULTISPECIES: helix-turn-helix domain-containing protein [Burkholderia]|uniref:helix-turn-helix domain-containing protein n=1 Tax=Burkholderia TaxID=32008 RepID=UPI00163F0CDF|nr:MULTISPECIES: helix-turn-helix transcriptional regulator [Burkholderia]UVS94929.1 XRE family transcriptional regulator [Burkholderia glumae]
MTVRSRPSLDWYRRKIFAIEDHDYMIGPPLLQENSVEPEVSDPPLSLAFGSLLRLERRGRELSVAALAQQLDVDEDEIRSIEHDPRYKARPRTIQQIASFFKLPAKEVMKLAGAASANDESFVEHAMRFAAHSDDMGALTAEEKHLLQSFVAFLRDNK